MSTNTIEIKKRTSEEITCWKVDAAELTPNTVIAVDQGITAVVKIDGQSKLLIGRSSTAHGLLNPGKTTKLIGGNKPYERAEIYAVDHSSEFKAEWGLGGPNAIPTIDPDYNVNASAVVFGEYYYKIESYINFVNAFTFDEEGAITRNDIREYLRNEIAGIAKTFFTAKLGQFGMRACQAKLSDFAEDLKENVNKHLLAKGITVYNFTVLKFSYDPKHLADIAKLDGKRMTNAAQDLDNANQMGQLNVVSAAADIQNKANLSMGHAIGMANGHLKPDGASSYPAKKAKQPAEKVVFCAKCGKKNTDAKFCSGCGAQLPE